MAQIKIPHTDNPFGIGVDIQSTQEMGMSAVPETQYGGAKMAKELESAAKAWQMEVEDTLAQDLMNELDQERLKQQDDPETGWAKQLGQNALQRESGKSLTEEAQENFKKSYETIRQKAATQRVRRLLDNFYKGADVSLTNNVNTHVNKQYEVYKNDVDQRTIQAAIPQALSDDPVNARSGYEVIKKKTEEIYKRRGLEPDYANTLGTVHSLKLNDLIDNDRLKEADEYFKANKGEMNAEQILKYEKARETAQEEAGIQGVARSIIDKYSNDQRGWLSMLSEANKLKGKNGRRSAAIIREHVEIQQRQLKLDNMQRELAILDCEKNNKEVPASLIAEMKEKDPEGYKRFYERHTTGQAVESDPSTYAHLKNLYRLHPEQFVEQSIDALAGRLSKKDMEHFKSLQKNIGDVQYKQYIDNVESIAKSKREFKNNPEALSELLSMADQVWEEQRMNRDKTTHSNEGVRKLAESLFAGHTSGWWSPSDYPYWKQRQKPKGGFYFSDDKDKIADVLKKAFPDAALNGFTKDSLSKANALYVGSYYAQMGGFPPEVREWAHKKIKEKREAAGMGNKPITNGDIDRAIFQAYFIKGKK